MCACMHVHPLLVLSIICSYEINHPKHGFKPHHFISSHNSVADGAQLSGSADLAWGLWCGCIQMVTGWLDLPSLCGLTFHVVLSCKVKLGVLGSSGLLQC